MLDWQVADFTQGICLGNFEKIVGRRMYGQGELLPGVPVDSTSILLESDHYSSPPTLPQEKGGDGIYCKPAVS